MEIFVLGVNHRTAPIELRESIAFLPEEATEAIDRLKAHDSVAEIVLLSTCNRTEFYAISENAEAAREQQLEIVKAFKSVDLARAGVTYEHRERDCVEHLFRVAAGIDSMVIGETGILHQVKEAFEVADERQTIGSVFGRLFRQALRVGKRSRSETDIGRGAVSLEKAGVQLAQKVFGDLGRRSVLVVGAGATGSRVGEFLREAGVGSMTFANRTVARAEELADRLGGQAVELGAIAEEAGRHDIVVTAVNSSVPILSRDDLKKAVSGRRRRQMLVVDLGVPRNVDALSGRVEGLFLYAVDDLQELVKLNLGRRASDVPAVESIVEQEADRFFEWIRALDTAPVVVALREQVDRVRRDSLARMKGSLSAEERELLERFSVSFMNKILHEPMVTVRRLRADTHVGLSRLHWTRSLFGLEGEPNPNGDHSGDES